MLTTESSEELSRVLTSCADVMVGGRTYERPDMSLLGTLTQAEWDGWTAKIIDNLAAEVERLTFSRFGFFPQFSVRAADPVLFTGRVHEQSLHVAVCPYKTPNGTIDSLSGGMALYFINAEDGCVKWEPATNQELAQAQALPNSWQIMREHTYTVKLDLERRRQAMLAELNRRLNADLSSRLATNIRAWIWAADRQRPLDIEIIGASLVALGVEKPFNLPY